MYFMYLFFNVFYVFVVIPKIEASRYEYFIR